MIMKLIDEDTEEHVATITLQDGVYSAELHSKTEIPILFGFMGEVTHPNPSQEQILFFLEDRVVPRNRQDLQGLLKEVGMVEWDLLKLLKLNGGKSSDDYYRLDIED